MSHLYNRIAIPATRAVFRSPPVVAKRQFATTSRLFSGDHDDGGYPGINLPFDISSPWKLTIMFALFFGSGFSLPFLILRRNLLKKNKV